MDEIDRRILRALQFDARITNQSLADRVGLSPSACWTRIKRLEESGAIDQYVTTFGQAALGLPDTAIVEVTLDRHDDAVFAQFEQAILGMPEVVEAYLLTGEFDYFLKVAVAGTSGYEAFLLRKLYKIPGIRHTRSCLTLRCLKQIYSPEP